MRDAKLIVIFLALLIAGAIDILTMNIPNIIFLVITLIALCFIVFDIVRNKSFRPILDYIKGAGVSILVLIVALLMFQYSNYYAIGGGDIKLLFAIGILFGFKNTLIIVLLTVPEIFIINTIKNLANFNVIYLPLSPLLFINFSAYIVWLSYHKNKNSNIKKEEITDLHN